MTPEALAAEPTICRNCGKPADIDIRTRTLCDECDNDLEAALDAMRVENERLKEGEEEVRKALIQMLVDSVFGMCDAAIVSDKTFDYRLTVAWVSKLSGECKEWSARAEQAEFLLAAERERAGWMEAALLDIVGRATDLKTRVIDRLARSTPCEGLHGALAVTVEPDHEVDDFIAATREALDAGKEPTT